MTTTPSLDRIAADGSKPNKITCKDGFALSVIAGEGLYCTPRPDRYYNQGAFNLGDTSGDYYGPYTHVEVGFPTERPEPWDKWSEYVEDSEAPTETVYGYVPVELVRELILAHGGER